MTDMVTSSTYNVAYTVGGVNYELTVKDLAISLDFPLRIDGDRRSSNSWNVVDLRRSVWLCLSFSHSFPFTRAKGQG